MAQQVSTNTFTVAKWVVSADPTQGTHTTIQAAINAASSGDNIFVRGGTYTENITLKAGITLTAAPGAERTPTVTIIGNTTFSSAGTVSISDIRLQTNGNFCISVTGVAASILKLTNCYINATNNTAISFTSSSASSQILIKTTIVDLTTTGIAIHSMTSPGLLEYRYCNTTNTGGSSTASSNSAGTVRYFYTNLLSPISTTGSGNFQNLYSQVDTSAQNVTAISVAGSGTSTTNYNSYNSGTATAVSVSGSHTLNLIRAVINSSNVNAISVSGSGVLKTGFVTFLGTSSGISGAAAFTTLAGHYITGTSIDISNDATASTINIGTGAAVKTVTLGSTNTTSSTTVRSGSGALNVTSTNGALTVNSGTGTLGISTDASATTVNIGTGAAAKTVTLGSTNSTSSLALKYGTNDFTLASATGTVMSALDTGEITYPLQSAFLAIPNATITDVTGDGTDYTTIFTTEIFDQNSDYNNSTGVFTAPVTGRYNFYINASYGDLTVAHTGGNTIIVTSNRQFLANNCNVGAIANSGFLGLNNTVIADMDAADTCTFHVQVTGSTKTVDLFTVGATDPRCSFGGNLVC